MLQKIDGRTVFIVEIKQDPPELLPINDGGDEELAPYAQALDAAIRTGVIVEPGKYAIELVEELWQVFQIFE